MTAEIYIKIINNTVFLQEKGKMKWDKIIWSTILHFDSDKKQHLQRSEYSVIDCSEDQNPKFTKYDWLLGIWNESWIF